MLPSLKHTSLLKRPKFLVLFILFLSGLFLFLGHYIFYHTSLHDKYALYLWEKNLREEGILHGEQLAASLEREAPFHAVLETITSSNTYLHRVHNAPMAITMIASDPYKTVAKLSLRNKYVYAKRRGYSLMVRRHHLLDRNPAWSKMGAILEAFDLGYPLVWMVDLDTIITNTSIPLHRFPEPIIEKKPLKSLFVSRDCAALNTGSFLIRNTPWSRYCLKTLEAAYNEMVDLQTHLWCEQEALIRNLHNNASWADYFQEVNDIFLNLYPGYCKNTRFWKPTDFMLHYAGTMRGDKGIGMYVTKYNETLPLFNTVDPNFKEEGYVDRVRSWYRLYELLLE